MSAPGTPILVDHAGPVTTITLNDPDRRNAINLDMRHQLSAALAEADASQTCRAVVLTGAGTAFSAGGDLSSMTDDRVGSSARLHASPT